MKMDEIRTDLIKGLIVFFLVLNLIALGFGYYIIDNKFKENTNMYNSHILAISRKEEILIEEINIVNKSKEDIYANLKELEQNISMLKIKINESSKDFSSISEETVYYKDKLSLVQNKNTELNIQKNALQNQLTLKTEAVAQLKLQQEQAAAKAAVKPVRRTRSS